MPLCGARRSIRNGRVLDSASVGFQSRFPDEVMLGGPLRALTYNKMCSYLESDPGEVDLPIMKFGSEANNSLGQKILIFDEAHHILKDDFEKPRQCLTEANGTVVLGLSATPFVGKLADGENLVRAISGNQPDVCLTASRAQCGDYPATIPAAARLMIVR